MYFPEGLENTPFKWKIFSNFVAFSEYPNCTYSNMLQVLRKALPANFFFKKQIPCTFVSAFQELCKHAT